MNVQGERMRAVHLDELFEWRSPTGQRPKRRPLRGFGHNHIVSAYSSERGSATSTLRCVPGASGSFLPHFEQTVAEALFCVSQKAHQPGRGVRGSYDPGPHFPQWQQ